MSKNRNRTKLRFSDVSTPAVSRSQFQTRKLVKRYGSMEDAHKALHRSLFEGPRKRKGIRSILIPGFQGWYFQEEKGGYLIIPPAGAIPTKKLCDTDPLFRGSEVSVLPKDTSLESVAKNWIKQVIYLTRENPALHRGVAVQTHDKQTIVVIKRDCPELTGLAAKTHKLAILFVDRFKFHLGMVDPIVQEKIIGMIAQNSVYNMLLIR